jgi:hypothetical protein
MEEQQTTEGRVEEPKPSIAEAINTGLQSMSCLVANYTAAVQATPKPANGQATSATEDQSPRK